MAKDVLLDLSQSPKLKSRNCHHHHHLKQQQQQQQQQQQTTATINGDVDSPLRQARLRHLVSPMQQRVRTIVPKLTNDMQKGQCGRIGVFGGCIMWVTTLDIVVYILRGRAIQWTKYFKFLPSIFRIDSVNISSWNILKMDTIRRQTSYKRSI